MATLIIAFMFVYIVGVAWCMWKAGTIQETPKLDEYDQEDTGADT